MQLFYAKLNLSWFKCTGQTVSLPLGRDTRVSSQIEVAFGDTTNTRLSVKEYDEF